MNEEVSRDIVHYYCSLLKTVTLAVTNMSIEHDRKAQLRALTTDRKHDWRS